MQPTLIVPSGEWLNEELGIQAQGAVPFRSAESLLDAHDRAVLVRWIRARTTPQRVVLRSCIVLLLAEDLSAREVARRLGVSRHTVDLWRMRYLAEGRESLLRDRPGRGRKRSA